MILLFASSLFATTLKDEAQDAFIAGEYEEALILFDSLLQDSTSTTRIISHEMRASIFEEYYGEIDSAIIEYTAILHENISTRKHQRIQKKITYLSNLGDEKEVYGLYRKTVMSREAPLETIRKLENILEEYPQFSLRNELREILISDYYSVKRYNLALEMIYDLKNDGVEVYDSRIMNAQRYAFRQNLVRVSLIFISIMAIIALVLTKNRGNHRLSHYRILSLRWFITTILFEGIYLIFFWKSDNNPFYWYSPLLLFGAYLIPILWSEAFRVILKGKVKRFIVGIIPSTVAFFMIFHLFLYFQKQPMELIDSFEERAIEILYTAEEIENG